MCFAVTFVIVSYFDFGENTAFCMCFGTFCNEMAKNLQKKSVFGDNSQQLQLFWNMLKNSQMTGFPGILAFLKQSNDSFSKLFSLLCSVFYDFLCVSSCMCIRESLGITPWILVKILRFACFFAFFVLLRQYTCKNSVSTHRTRFSFNLWKIEPMSWILFFVQITAVCKRFHTFFDEKAKNLQK